MRPIGEMDLGEEQTERVKCWQCGAVVEVEATRAHVSCPECASRVAVHRLKLPSMPAVEKKRRGASEDEVVRLREAVGPGELADGARGERSVAVGGEQVRVPMLENGAPASILEQGSTPDASRQARLPFAARRTIDQRRAVPERRALEERSSVERRRRDLFEEADPRMEGVKAGGELGPSPGLRALAVSLVVFVVLALVAVVLALRG